jgi:putative methionine-R-sulfoxide reductase with GAF domain
VSGQEALRGALDAVERILNRGGDADDVLRAVVAAVHSRLQYDWVGIRLVEGDDLVLGPAVGVAGGPETTVPISYEGSKVGELDVSGDDAEDRAFLERVAVLISAYCLVGWDTGGERWKP